MDAKQRRIWMNICGWDYSLDAWIRKLPGTLPWKAWNIVKRAGE